MLVVALALHGGNRDEHEARGSARSCEKRGACHDDTTRSNSEQRASGDDQEGHERTGGRNECRSDSRTEANHARTQKGSEMSTLVRKQTGPKTGKRYAQPPDRTARLFRQSELVFHGDQDEMGGDKFRSAREGQNECHLPCLVCRNADLAR